MPMAADPWEVLGVPRLEGPRPTLEFLLERARLALDLLAFAGRAPWVPPAHLLADARSAVQAAMADCEHTGCRRRWRRVASSAWTFDGAHGGQRRSCPSWG